MSLEKSIEINGEQIPVSEALQLIQTLYNDAAQIAGEFHGMERSAKFRLNWPDEDIFVRSNWKSFVAAAREMYSAQLGDPHVEERKKQAIFKALVLERKIAEGQETDNRLQLKPNTQQFVGDRRENRLILDKFGAKPNFRAALANGAAKILATH